MLKKVIRIDNGRSVNTFWIRTLLNTCPLTEVITFSHIVFMLVTNIIVKSGSHAYRTPILDNNLHKGSGLIPINTSKNFPTIINKRLENWKTEEILINTTFLCEKKTNSYKHPISLSNKTATFTQTYKKHLHANCQINTSDGWTIKQKIRSSQTRNSYLNSKLTSTYTPKIQKWSSNYTVFIKLSNSSNNRHNYKDRIFHTSPPIRS